jgi:alpha-galactosidase
MKYAISIWFLFLLCSFSISDEKVIWVSDMNLSLFDMDMGQAQKNKTPMGTPIVISGVTYENGVGIMAPSKCLIELNGIATRFYAEVGACEMRFPDGGAPGAPGGPGGPGPGGPAPSGMPLKPSMKFYVLGDKRVLWDSGVMKEGDKAKPIDIEVIGIKKLALVVVSISGMGPFGGIATWANAKITYSGDEVPRTIPLTKSIAGVKQIFTPVESEFPKINYPKIVGATPSKQFIFPIPVTGKKPLLVTVDNLPTGLTLDSVTGIISGTTPSKKGTYSLNITVKNSLGEAKGTIDLKVGDLLALTPPMGWNSWNAGGMSVDQNKVKAAADVIAEKLRGHGWAFLIIDDGWQSDKRTENGELLTNVKFSDIKGMSDYIHSKGIRFGIYSSPGPQTCGGSLGSYQHELKDAMNWAKWGVDYLKYDWCSYGTIAKDNSLEELKKPYAIMQQAIVKTNRDIVYSLCQYGMGDVSKWGAEVNGNLWRTTMDINDSWKSVLNTGFIQTDNYQYVNPGHWNDPDMLVVGQVGWSKDTKPTKLSPDEQYAHISLWSLLSSPLLIGCDMGKLDAFTLGLITNDEVIAVNQDVLGKQAQLIQKGDDYQVWAKDMADGSKAVGLFYTGIAETTELNPVKMINWGNEVTENSKLIGIDFKALGLSGKQKVRNLWSQQDLGTFNDRFESDVNYHGVVLMKISPVK